MSEVNTGNLQTGVVSTFPALHKNLGQFSIYSLTVPANTAANGIVCIGFQMPCCTHIFSANARRTKALLNIISLGLKLCLR